MATKTLSVVIAGDAKGAQSAFQKVESDADGLSGKLSGLGSKISPGMAAAAGAVVAGVGLMLRGAWQAAEESAKIGRETERVLKTTGATAWTTAGQVSDYAGELSNLTGVDDEVIQSGENLLLTFTNVQNKIGDGNDVFDRATAAALDMSTVLGTDMSSAAIMVGKALNDPRDGLTKLTRAGVTFTEQQKDQIRTLTEAGDVLGAQKIILGELEREFGGAAAAAATPFDKLKVQLENLQESLGSVLIPVVAVAATALQGLVTGFSSLPGPIQAAIVGIGAFGAAGAGIVTVVAKIADTFAPAFAAAKGALDTAALGAANLATKIGLSDDKALKLATSISGLGGGVAAGALAGITAAFIGFSIVQEINAKKAAEQRKRADEFTAAIESQTGALQENVNAVVAQQFANDGVGKIISGTTANVKLFGDAVVNASDRIKVLSDEADTGRLENFENELRKGRDAGDALSTEMLRLKESGELSTTQLMELANQLDDTSDAYNQGRTAAELNKGMTDAMATAQQNAAAAAKLNADAIRDAADATRAAVDPFFAASDAQRQLEKAQVDAFLAAQNYAADSPEMVSANEAVARAALNVEDKYSALAAQMQENGATQDEMKAAFQRWVDQGYITQGQADQVIGKFSALAGTADAVGQKNVAIPVSAPGADSTIGKLAALKQKIDEFNNSGVRIPVGASVGIPGSAGGGGLQEGWNIVGENGPEPVWKSGSIVDVYPNSKPVSGMAPSGGGGGGNVYNVYVSGAVTGEDVVEALKRYERRNGTAWRN